MPPSVQRRNPVADEPRVEPPEEWVKDGFVFSPDPPGGDLLEQALPSENPLPAIGDVDVEDDDEATFGSFGKDNLHNMPPPPPGVYDGIHDYEPPKEVRKGSKSEVKKLYQGPQKCACCINWVETPPLGSKKELITKAKWGEFAVVVRQTAHGGDKSWMLHSIVVHSPHILDVLRQHLSKYPGLAMESEEVQFTSPFAPLLHFWPEIVGSMSATDEKEAADHFKLFRQVMDPELESPAKRAVECAKHGKIEFDALWTVFKPGSLVHWEQDGQSNIGHLKETATRSVMGSVQFDLKLEQVNFDGYRFGHQEILETIEGFEGFKSIFELPMPLDMKPDRETVKRQLIERGKKFEALRGYHFKAYNGKATITSGGGMFGSSSEQNINGRVIVDAATYYSSTASAPMLAPLVEARVKDVVDPLAAQHPPMDPFDPSYPVPHRSKSSHARHHDPYYDDLNYGFGGMPPPPPLPRSTFDSSPTAVADLPALSNDQLLLCVSHVRGFILKTKEWGKLNVHDISDIAWENTFDNLVLPNQAKDLLLAFAKSKMSGDALFDDFVGGKGKGIIMLLSGPPGVGKTLTAEAIAEKLKVPVYTLSAGELGSVASNVEAALVSAMTKCARWNAVLLLDECDVFLEKRELNSLKRNELVSIFLRLVEYYEGIMLLTTNRISTIDPAFESRVDVAIAYDALTAPLRQQIWENFLVKLRRDGGVIDEESLTDSILKSLAEHELNGRQIKSVIKTAQLLARSKEQLLGFEHLETVVTLNKVRGKSIPSGLSISAP